MFAAKDKDGYISLYNHMPIRGDGEWFASEEDTEYIDGECAIELTIPLDVEDYPNFSDLRWEADPIEVALFPKRKEID